VQLEAHIVVAKPFAGQARPVEGVFAFLDILFCLTALIVELCDTLWFTRHGVYPNKGTKCDIGFWPVRVL
jgi:hypothetical protein